MIEANQFHLQKKGGQLDLTGLEKGTQQDQNVPNLIVHQEEFSYHLPPSSMRVHPWGGGTSPKFWYLGSAHEKIFDPI